jgi:salicylate 5-hydroxylase large subunit
MNETSTVFPDQPVWEGDGTHRIPFLTYTSEEIYRKELERFFYKGHWCYVGLEAEVPNPGDFKRTVVGERSVILARDADGALNVVENVCAHRGMRFCRERHGNRKDFVCPYHQWSYTLKGDLQGVPFRRGVKQDGKVNGGMPADFKTADHGLTKLKVASRGGVVFASFDHDVESLEDYLGPTILGYFDRLFNGRRLKILGYNRQRIPGNWKLMQENIKDPYHPGCCTPGSSPSASGAPTTSRSCAWTQTPPRGDDLHPRRRRQGEPGDPGVQLQGGMKLQRPELHRHRARTLVGRAHGGDDDDFPQRHPAAAGQQRVHAPYPAQWPRQLRFRLDALRLRGRQRGDDAAPAAPGQPVRPAGFVSADDGEVIEFSQQAFETKPFHRAVADWAGATWATPSTW